MRLPTVPWKDPHNWLVAEIMAPAFSFFLALLRTIYQEDATTWTRRLLESALCGLVTLSATYAINAMGVHGDWKIAVAGGIGLLGVDYIRNLAKRLINKKVEK